MKITFTKRYEHKDANGRTIYPQNATLPVTDEVAIGAVIAGCTDDPIAIALAEKSGAKKAANKVIDKMTAKELKAELKRILAGEPDKGQSETIKDLTAQFEAATKAKEIAADQVTTLTTDAQVILDAHNASLGKDNTDERCETLADLAALITLSNELASGGHSKAS